jgi:REP element-mobilizing transposase RayT
VNVYRDMTNEVFHMYRRRLPHWRVSGSVYFITFRLIAVPLNSEELRYIRDHVRAGSGKWYSLLAVQVMPDHVHLLFSPDDGIELSRITKGLKGATARRLNQDRKTRGIVWQHESWDRIVRDQAELDEKLEYMFQNPVKTGLTTKPELWVGWYCDLQRI